MSDKEQEYQSLSEDLRYALMGYPYNEQQLSPEMLTQIREWLGRWPDGRS
jgi:hypothetical protein